MRWRLIIFAVGSIVMIGLYKAVILIAFAARTLGFGNSPIAPRATVIGEIPADVYVTGHWRGSVLLVHGVNETGKDSPELRPVIRALASAGFRVVVPEFARLKRQNVTSADVDDVVSVFQSLGEDAGIICASYGCGPALIAAATPKIRSHVRFVLTFGGYFDLTDCLRFIITSPPSPLAYSKWTYMGANSGWLSDETDRQLIQAIANERASRVSEHWHLTNQNLSAEGRAFLSVFESETRAAFDGRLEKTPVLKAQLEKLSPSRYFDGLNTSLIIVHMSSDPCIPSSESGRMAEAAQSHHIPYNLTILEMYGHTRPQLPPAGIVTTFGFYIPESLKLVRVLDEVLRYAN